jgi:predicted acetyltransferase
MVTTQPRQSHSQPAVGLPGLRLRPPGRADEAAFRAAHEAMAAEGRMTFGLRYTPGMCWDSYLRLLEGERAGVNLPAGLVPSTFLVAEVDGEIVGRVSIRHRLNDVLAREGGHIGYCVLPPHRRRRYATTILGQALVIARAHGIGRILVTCDDSNAGSAAVIEACGGTLAEVAAIPGRDVPVRRYWIS